MLMQNTIKYILVTLATLTGCDGRAEHPDVTTDKQKEQSEPDIQFDSLASTEATEPVDETSDIQQEQPQPICKAGARLNSPPFFADRSEQMGLRSPYEITGNRLMSCDINSDTFPDLIVHHVGANDRDEPLGTPPRFKRWVMLNVDAGGRRKFENYTIESNYTVIRGEEALVGRACHFAICADIDNDGDNDLFSGTYVNSSPDADPPDPGDRSELLLNDGEGHFQLAPLSDIWSEEKRTTTSATFLDYDRDGFIDLFVGNWYETYGYLYGLQDRLYKGRGDGTFVEVTYEVGLETTRTGFVDGTNHRPTYGVSSCDIDGDGDSDLIVSAYGRQFNMLWLNEDGYFVDVGAETGFAADDNMDYTDNEFYKCYCQQHPDTCTAEPPSIACGNYWNPGIDDQPFRLGGNTFTTVCADIDNDLDNDLFNTEIRHWHIGQSSDPTQLLINEPVETFPYFQLTRVDNRQNGLYRNWMIPNWNEGDISAIFFDFDNDGLKDIFLACSDYPHTRGFLFHQKPDGNFEEIATTSGVALPRSQQITAADYDRDGDLDLIVGFSMARPDDPPQYDKPYIFYFENTIGQDGNSIEILLEGDPFRGCNRSAIGATVEVRAGELVQMQELTGGYGHFGLQNDLVLHFGLGDKCMVDKIEIRWPDSSSSSSTYTNIQANYLIKISQSQSHVQYLMRLE